MERDQIKTKQKVDKRCNENAADAASKGGVHAGEGDKNAWGVWVVWKRVSYKYIRNRQRWRIHQQSHHPIAGNADVAASTGGEHAGVESAGADADSEAQRRQT